MSNKNSVAKPSQSSEWERLPIRPPHGHRKPRQFTGAASLFCLFPQLLLLQLTKAPSSSWHLFEYILYAGPMTTAFTFQSSQLLCREKFPFVRVETNWSGYVTFQSHTADKPGCCALCRAASLGPVRLSATPRTIASQGG